MDWDEVADLAKEYADCISDLSNMAAAGCAIVAGGLTMTGAGAPVAGLWAVDSGIFWLASAVWGEVAEDPPQLNYKKAVSWPAAPKISLKPIRLVQVQTSRSLRTIMRKQAKGVALAQTMLDAMERYKGASGAGDAAYADKHGRMMRRVAITVMKLTSETKEAMLDMAKAIEGTPSNVLITQDLVRAFLKSVKKDGLAAEFKNGLVSLGLSAAKQKAYEKWLLSYDYSTFKEAKLSWHLRQFYFQLKSAESKLISA